MSAELTLALLEAGLDLAQAKAVAAEAPTNVPELALALIEHGVSISEARGIAERSIATAPPAARMPSPAVRERVQAQRAARAGQHMGEHDTKEAAYGTYSPVVGPDGLTDKQRNALGNVGLCPNCQQPNSDHLPGCARASREDPNAVTKNPLPPAI